MITMDIHLKDSELKSAVETLEMISQNRLKNALKRANIKMGKWFSTYVARDISRHYGLKVSMFKKFRITMASYDFKSGSKPVMVWIGYAPIAAHLIGEAKQDAGGVWVKDFYFKNAFVRKDGEFFGQVYARRSRRRLPIDIQKVDIRKGAEMAIDRLIKRGEERFKTILTQEINFELSKL